MVGLLGLMSLQMVAIRGNMSSRAFTEATSLAQERQEYLMTVPYSSLASVPAEATSPLLNAQGQRVSAGIYSRATTVAACAGIANCLNVTVVVSWNDFELGSSKTHSVTLFQRRTP
jgi:hypothetical protein